MEGMRSCRERAKSWFCSCSPSKSAKRPHESILRVRIARPAKEKQPWFRRFADKMHGVMSQEARAHAHEEDAVNCANTIAEGSPAIPSKLHLVRPDSTNLCLRARRRAQTCLKLSSGLILKCLLVVQGPDHVPFAGRIPAS